MTRSAAEGQPTQETAEPVNIPGGGPESGGGQRSAGTAARCDVGVSCEAKAELETVGSADGAQVIGPAPDGSGVRRSRVSRGEG